ncbi:MAG TPA: Npt1/Npt2 family nucleotide transporter [Rhabdochlamydiaceae bacterium]|nr:Npt1/Npt2 family nucleotide transporter [Rhabdochlamydiaceae bacterium]
MASQTKPEFGKLRSFFWPVHRSECRIFVPLLLIYFLITFNYSMLRAAKDSLVITAKSSGAEAIPFIKVWAILPAAILITYLFTRLSNKYKIEHVFYLMMSLFLGFFLLFAFVLYPMQDYLHPNAFADHLEQILPHGFKGFIAIFRNWTFTLFYVMSELWGTAIMTVLFWGFVNEITSIEAAKRFYVLLTLGANLSAIVSGEMAGLISHWGTSIRFIHSIDPWGNSLILLASLVFLSGICAVAIFRWLNRNGLKTFLSDSSFQFNHGPSEIKMGLRKNFSYLAKSKYLTCIAIIVVTYNIAINLTEVVWKDQLHQICPDPNDYQAYMGKVLTWVGVMSTIIGLSAGAILRRFNWTITAMIPPFILLATGIGFFSFLIFKDTGLSLLSAALGSTPLAIGVFFGSMQNCLSRASKYTLFDATKELSFIPLSKECKLKGKAAIDGVGSRIGKSGGAVVYQFLLMSLGTVGASTPYVGVILLFVVGGWMFAVRSLGKQFTSIMTTKGTVDIPEKVPEPLAAAGVLPKSEPKQEVSS